MLYYKRGQEQKKEIVGNRKFDERIKIRKNSIVGKRWDKKKLYKKKKEKLSNFFFLFF